MHADRTNRGLLSLIGLLAVAIGAAGLLSAAGVFGQTWAHRRLTDNRFSRYFSDHGSWLWPTLAAVALVIMLLALIWLLRLLFSTDRAGDLTLAKVPARQPAQELDSMIADHPAAGRTVLQASALTGVVASEIETYHGVTAARARVLGDPADPTLAIDVTATRRADLPALIQRIERDIIADVRAALESDRLPVKLDIAVTNKGVTRTS